ncbi:MAG: hypothetical protein AAB339_05715 [Elusimicrobiota bacterium]
MASGSTITFPSATVLTSSGFVTAFGGISFTASHRTLLSATTYQTFNAPSVGILQVANATGAALASGLSLSVLGDLLIDPGSRLNAPGNVVSVYGDWANGGAFNPTGGRVDFVHPTATQQERLGGHQFLSVRVDKASSTLRFSTATVVAGNVTLATGTLDLGALTHRWRGAFTQLNGTLVSTGSVVIFDGASSQTVTLLLPNSFDRLLSSSAVSVKLATHTAVEGNLEIHRGSLDFSTMALTLKGSLLNLSAAGSFPATNRSTVTFSGTGAQTILFFPYHPLDSVVAANSAAGVVLGDDLLLNRNFTIMPGAVFNGASHTLTLQGPGALWSTPGADYRMTSGHYLRWFSPSLFVAAGSTVNALIELTGKLSVDAVSGEVITTSVLAVTWAPIVPPAVASGSRS